MTQSRSFSWNSVAFLAVLLLGFIVSKPASAQRSVDERNLGERLIVIVPIVGTGTAQDPKRPLFVPTPEERIRDGATSLQSFTAVYSDDGKFALVEFVGSDRKAFEAIFKSTRADVKWFDHQNGRATAEAIDEEFRKFKKDFDFKKFKEGK
jgi:hypothetical protein